MDGSDHAGGDVVRVASEESTVLTSTSLIAASRGEIDSGGGDIRILSDARVIVKEGDSLQARGGAVSGDGGFVEVSSADSSLDGAVDTSAPDGRTETFLLDPTLSPSSMAAGERNGHFNRHERCYHGCHGCRGRQRHGRCG